ncbi:MAG: putative phosphoglycerate mutase [Chlamydiales bacterium]|jgi:probable phosphoglycerate mutase
MKKLFSITMILGSLLFPFPLHSLEFWAVRHGETDWNKEGRIQGYEDIPLNTQGKEQAWIAKNKLKDFDFDAYYSSDLSRAHETALIILGNDQITPPPISLQPQLREYNCGALGGSYRTEEVSRAWQMHLEGKETIPGAETENDLKTRVLSFLEELEKKHSNNERILFVTHRGVIRSLLKEASVSASVPEIQNCSITKFQFSDGILKFQGIS